jgi:hypothetical protein
LVLLWYLVALSSDTISDGLEVVVGVISCLTSLDYLLGSGVGLSGRLDTSDTGLSGLVSLLGEICNVLDVLDVLVATVDVLGK